MAIDLAAILVTLLVFVGVEVLRSNLPSWQRFLIVCLALVITLIVLIPAVGGA